jgi:hypothetical protein
MTSEPFLPERRSSCAAPAAKKFALSAERGQRTEIS